MSEEEIKIIEDFLNYNITKQISGIEINAVSKLLNSYYKQQKEIKELKEKEKNLLYQLKDSERELLEITQNSISKDKIKEIIKKYAEEDVITYKELTDLVAELNDLAY